MLTRMVDQLKDKAFCYIVNNSKSWLIVKEEYLNTTNSTFEGTGVCNTHSGRWHLGSALGTRGFTEEYIQEKVTTWKPELERLASFAKTKPHAAFTALTHGLRSRWVYHLRTVERLAPLLQPLEDNSPTVHTIPNWPRPPSDSEIPHDPTCMSWWPWPD